MADKPTFTITKLEVTQEADQLYVQKHTGLYIVKRSKGLEDWPGETVLCLTEAAKDALIAKLKQPDSIFEQPNGVTTLELKYEEVGDGEPTHP